ncbi:uncharacterized protein LOC134842028 [Symsagittifera roscoffensis]|uniref:uncharacterized protein LOC134842028 n=1 Tax=Symsagittifera roscoffensis TaxID=84072 RepID=UPI00307B9A2E
MSLTVKAFFKEEIRRFALDVSNATSFAYLEGKVRTSFQNLPAKGKLLLRWKDSDGDLVTFSTDDELVEALSSAENGVFRVHLAEKESPRHNDNGFGDAWLSGGIQDVLGCPPPLPPHHGHAPPPPLGPHPGFPFGSHGCFNDGPAVHHFVTCDQCNASPIVGTRYKCKTCPDYDLCSTCKVKGLTCGNADHQFKQISHVRPGQANWGPRGGGRWGRGRGKCPMLRKMDGEQSSDEEAGNSPKHCGGPLGKEEREKLINVVNIVKESAKTQAFEVAGAVAGDCAGEAAAVAVRSSIRRALIVQRRSGLGPKQTKHTKPKKHHDGSSSSSDESDTDYETAHVIDSATDSKKLKKQSKVAAKAVAKLAAKEVTESFGKLAGKWAAQAVKQSMLVSIKMCVKAEAKREKKQAKKDHKQFSVTFHEDATSNVEQMEGVWSGVNTNSATSAGAGVSEPLSVTLNNVPIYPMAPPEQVPLHSEPQQPVLSAEDQAIMDAIAAFKNMGFTPDEKLVDEIKKAKGDITVVFDQMKK